MGAKSKRQLGLIRNNSVANTYRGLQKEHRARTEYGFNKFQVGLRIADGLERYVREEEMQEMGMMKRVLRSQSDQWCIIKRKKK
jgi:hypothetical protein